MPIVETAAVKKDVTEAYGSSFVPVTVHSCTEFTDSLSALGNSCRIQTERQEALLTAGFYITHTRLSIKYKNAHYNFPELKVPSSNCFLWPFNSPKKTLKPQQLTEDVGNWKINMEFVRKNTLTKPTYLKAKTGNEDDLWLLITGTVHSRLMRQRDQRATSILADMKYEGCISCLLSEDPSSFNDSWRDFQQTRTNTLSL